MTPRKASFTRCQCKNLTGLLVGTTLYLPQASFDFTALFAGSDDATPLASVSREHAAVVEIKEEALPRDPGDARNRTPVAIILEPARELAEQVSDCLTDFKVSCVVLCCAVLYRFLLLWG